MLNFVESSGAVNNGTSIALVTAATFIVGIWVWSQQKPSKNFPPGPKGWPVIGNILEFASGKPPYVLFMDYAEKYGDIFSLRIGQRWTVVLNGSCTIKEALVKKAVEFANRPNTFSLETITEGGTDILGGQYTQPSWKLHRKLVLSAFRSLAIGNNEHFEKLVYSVLPGMITSLDENQSKAFDPKPLLGSCIYNILATMCFGKQYEFNGLDIAHWMELSRRFLDIGGKGLIADFIPMFIHIPTKRARDLRELSAEFLGKIEEEIIEHRAKYDGGEPKDLIEMLFHYKEEMKREGKEDMNQITDTHIKQTVSDVFNGHYSFSL